METFKRSGRLSGGTGAARRNLAYRRWIVAVLITFIQLLLFVQSSQASRSLPRHDRGSKRLQPYLYPSSNSSGPAAAARHGPAVKSFQLSDRSWVDCVPVEHQIAAHHPALKNHIIHMVPSSDLLHLQEVDVSSAPVDHDQPHPQAFAREHGGCPEGSIPVQRSEPEQIAFRKHHRPEDDYSRPDTLGAPAHEYAIISMAREVGAYKGQGTTLSVNDPIIGDPDSEFSLSQVWVLAGSYANDDLNTAETGWHVYPALHPSNFPLAPHLFIYWTMDAYQGTGCYNLHCAGFVQVNRYWVLGGVLAPYTTLGENANSEYEVRIRIVYDSQTPGWWLNVQGTWVGYWPSAIYTTLQTGADQLQWGGEIAPSDRTNGHTTTGMGSGAFAQNGFPVAAYHKQVTYADYSGKFYDADFSYAAVTDANCYNLEAGNDPGSSSGSYFYFGGPGGLDNDACAQQL